MPRSVRHSAVSVRWIALLVAFGSTALAVGCGSEPSLAETPKLFSVDRDGSGLKTLSETPKFACEEAAQSCPGRGATYAPPAHPAQFHGTADPPGSEELVWSLGSGRDRAEHRVGGFLRAPAYVSWSPNSDRLVVGATRFSGDRRFHLYTVSAREGTLDQITGEVITTAPAWSPDGRWIAFSNYKGNLNLVHPDGTDQHTIVDFDSAEIRGIAWSSDGAHLTFTASKPNEET